MRLVSGFWSFVAQEIDWWYSKSSAHVTCGRGTVFVWRRCDMLCKLYFRRTNAVMLSHNGSYSDVTSCAQANAPAAWCWLRPMYCHMSVYCIFSKNKAIVDIRLRRRTGTATWSAVWVCTTVTNLCCPLLSFFEYKPTPLFCRLFLAVMRKHDVVHKTGST